VSTIPLPAPQPSDHRQAAAGGQADRWTVQAVLDWTTGHLADNGSESPRLDAEILLAQARDCRRIELYTQFDQALTDQQRSVMRDLVKRRAAREPVAYLVGFREFFGIDFALTSDTLIPRPDTETLIVELLDLARQLTAPPAILDLGTGCGCIAITIATQLASAHVSAVDICPAALEVARSNAETHNVADRIAFSAGDLYGPIPPDRKFQFIASNPPYVTTAELDQLAPDIRDHEPRTALDGGADGLDVIRRLVAEAPGHLAPGGSLLCEISPEQADGVGRLVTEQPAFRTPRTVTDLSGQARVIVASID